MHTDRWNIYSENTRSLVKAFQEQGIEAKLRDLQPAGEKKDLS